jgi:hypothetical protein
VEPNGVQIMHGGRALELLYKVGDQTDGTQIWRARPLFTSNQTPLDIFIKPGDRCTPLHTNAGRMWGPGPA